MDPGLPIRGRRRWSFRFAALIGGLMLLVVVPTTGASALSKPGCAGWHYDNLSRQANSLYTLLGPYVFNKRTPVPAPNTCRAALGSRWGTDLGQEARTWRRPSTVRESRR